MWLNSINRVETGLSEDVSNGVLDIEGQLESQAQCEANDAEVSKF